MRRLHRFGILILGAGVAGACTNSTTKDGRGNSIPIVTFQPACGSPGDTVTVTTSFDCSTITDVFFHPGAHAAWTPGPSTGPTGCNFVAPVPEGAGTGPLELKQKGAASGIVTADVFTIPCPDAGTGGVAGSGGTGTGGSSGADSGTGGTGGIDASAGGTGGFDASTGGTGGFDASTGGTGGLDASTGGTGGIEAGILPGVPVGTFTAGTKNEGFTRPQGITPWGTLPIVIAAQNNIHVLDFSVSPPVSVPPGSVFPAGATSGLDLLGVKMLGTVEGNKHIAVNSLMGWTGFRTWDNVTKTWTSYFEDGSMSDVTIIGNGPQSTGFIGANGDIAITLPSTTAPGGFIAPPYISVPGNVYSAYQDLANSSIIYITNDTAQLGIIPGASPFTPIIVGNVGSDPRRLRYSNPFAVVSNFVSDTLTIVFWNGAALSATIVGNVPVGDGPVGIGLTAKPGQTWIASTGYNDDSYSVTVLDNSNGSVVSNKQASLPSGCTQPGHADFVPAPAAPAGVRVAVTCANGLNVVEVPP